MYGGGDVSFGFWKMSKILLEVLGVYSYIDKIRIFLVNRDMGV